MFPDIPFDLRNATALHGCVLPSVLPEMAMRGQGCIDTAISVSAVGTTATMLATFHPRRKARESLRSSLSRDASNVSTGANQIAASGTCRSDK